MKRILLSFVLLVSAVEGFGQIEIDDNQTAQALASMLVGPGVVMLNPTLSCPTIANGKFKVTSSNLGIDSGIVLTSGRAETSTSGTGANGSPTLFASTSNSASGDADLTTLVNSNTGGSLSTYDACVLQFDFVPAGDTVMFDYVFGSEEYPTYNCSINDVFGFFISGPGITGNANIALVPGTTNTMVGISTVNDGTGGYTGSSCDLNTFGNGPYTQYYISNTAASTTIVYNGMTQVFTATAIVTACDTYHLKLAIADASDGVFDSGVFIKAGSLTTTGVKTTPSTGGGQNADVTHTVRGCIPAKIAFARSSCNSDQPLTYKLFRGGTAVNGVDYVYIPDTLVIPAYTDIDTLEIQALNVANPTGTKYVIIGVYNPDSVAAGVTNPPIISRDTVWIYDSLYVNIATAATTVCPRTAVTISAEIASGLDYVWAPAGLVPVNPGLTISVTPSVSTTYTITVTQPGAPATCPPVSRAYTVTVEPIPEIILPSHDTILCLQGDSTDLQVRALPDGLDYVWSWSPATYLRDSYSANNKFFAPVGNYKYVVTAFTPVAYCSASDSMLIEVVPPFTFDWVSPLDTTINYGDEIQLNSSSEALYWLWSPITYLSDPIAKDPYAKPLESIVYTLKGINQYGCYDTASVKINVVYASNSGMPNAFTPNGDGLNDVFQVANLRFDKLTEFRIFNRWGRQVFETNVATEGWDGTIKGAPAAADVYHYYIKISLPDGTPKVLKGDVTLIR
ncbi:MAG: choice-of-anchor L domain-containing protein [Edaphocola sp.]